MTVPRDGLVLELTLDGSADDTSGGGHHGVIHGGVPTADRFGRPSGALLFDGVSDQVVVSPPPNLPADALTVTLWARVDTGDMRGWSQCFICQDNGDDADQSRRVFQLSVLDGHVVWHRMMGARDPTSPRFVIPGAWFHVAATVDGLVHRLYVDGQLQGTTRHQCRAHADEPIYLGRKGTLEPPFFCRGALDDVRLYRRALGSDEIQALYLDGGYEPPVHSRRTAPPISGMWGPEDEALLDLRFDGQSRVSGAVIAGQRGNLAAIERGTFDVRTGRLALEGQATRPDNGLIVPYTITGSLAARRLRLHYRFGDTEGDVTVRDVARGRALRYARRGLAHWMGRRLEPMAIPLLRWWRGRRRPSSAQNAARLAARGEATSDFVFRDAVSAEIPALSRLHVKTWAATYPMVRRPPTYEIREHQWREAFAKADGTWFCIVIENARGDLVGFAKGVKSSPLSGDLNKIYLLEEYQRLGLGRRLVGVVARRFLGDGITTMTLSADAANPSCRFYLRLGAEHQRDEEGRMSQGAFIWHDLERLAAICPVKPIPRRV